MRLTTALVASLAVAVTAAPTWPTLQTNNLINPSDALDAVSQYFNLVANQISSVKALGGPPQCNLDNAVMPTLAGMPPPTPGSKLRHVAVGRGTQNYTCDGSADSKPKAIGAVATLYNITCLAATYPDVSSKIPGMAVHFNLDAASRLGPAMLSVSGHHFFTAQGVPFFNLDTPQMDLGTVPSIKNTSLAAPPGSPVGQKGEPAVPWLRLLAAKDATGGLGQVYRVLTAGGSAPATCEGVTGAFEVQYSAEYWFWT